MSTPVVSIGVRRADGYIQVLSTLNNFNDELDKHEFDLLIDHLLQTYQSVGVAAEVYVVEMFQNSAEHLYEDPYPPSVVGKFVA